MRPFLLTSLLLLAWPTAALANPDWPDATPTSWHRLARAESLLSAPEPPNPVAVCVVDSGVNMTPDLEGVVIERLAYDGGDPGDTYPQEGIDDGHGTYVATFLAGQVNGWGGAGLWPRAKIVSVRVFPPGGQRAKAHDYIEGIRMCRQRQHVRVINLSLGGVVATDEELAELRDTLVEFRNRHGINIVAAAGNRGGEVEVPARFDAVFAVGAVSPSGEMCTLSARGVGLDLAAGGCSLEGADLHGHPVRFHGTSFAAPQVAAALAALRSYSDLDADQAEKRILDTATQRADISTLDVGAAVRAYLPTSSSGQQQPIVEKAPTISSSILQTNFERIPRPRLRRRRAGDRILVSVLNRPQDATTELRYRKADVETKRTRFRFRRGTRVAFRFLSDDGFSPWTVIRS